MALDQGTRAQIIRLARSGALERAWSLLETAGLAADDADPRALTLRARLEKDRAKQASGADRARWLERSAATYLRAAEAGGGSYPLINAATLSLLAGRRLRAEQLAQQVLDQLDGNPDEAETRYWLGATRAEALLLLGKLPEARAALRAAAAEAPLAWEDRAATIGQLGMICAEIECDAAWLAPLRPPRSVQYTGIMAVAEEDTVAQARIADWLEAENVGFGFGALAAGADIWIAEALVARGAALNVVLPCPVEAFRTMSVAAVDPGWVPRFDRLLEAADSVDELDAASAPSLAAVNLTDAVSLGLAIHNARILQSEPLRLRIAGERDTGRRASPSAVRETVLTSSRRSGGADFHVSEQGAARAMLRAGEAADRGGALEFFAGPAAAWAAAQPLIRDQRPVAMDFRFVGHGSPEAEATARLEALAGVAEPGQTLASKAMAFALLAEAPEARIETMGEIRAACGFFPVYAVT
jgi:hypothetical protein